MFTFPVFTNLEAPPAPYYWDFMVAASGRHDQLSTPFPAPLPFLGNEGVGLKCPNFLSWLNLSGGQPPSRKAQGPTQSCLIRTKDTHITQEIKRNLGTLSQEPGSKTKILKQKILLAFYLQGMQKPYDRNWREQRPIQIFILISQYIFLNLDSITFTWINCQHEKTHRSLISLPRLDNSFQKTTHNKYSLIDM